MITFLICMLPVAFVIGWALGWMKGEDHEFWYWRPRVEALIRDAEEVAKTNRNGRVDADKVIAICKSWLPEEKQQVRQ